MRQDVLSNHELASRLRESNSVQWVSNSPEETMEFARTFASMLAGGDVLCLSGDLGAGKTVFMKGLAKGLGLEDESEVKSPTFVIMHVYPCRIPLYHFDLYRLESDAELAALGLEDFMADSTSICCMEWGEKANNLLPLPHYKISIQNLTETRRQISVERVSPL